jgi:hypothetical protein
MKLTKLSALLLMSAFVICLGTAIDASGQTTNRKPRPRPLATPIPSGDAAVVSVGTDYNNEIILQPVERPARTSETPAPNSSQSVRELTERIQRLEGGKTSTYDEKQKRLLLNLDILTRAEQRSESLRKQLFELIEKENTTRTRLDQIEYESRPEMIERSAQMVGSMKPEELRDARRRSLEGEKRNLTALLDEIRVARENISANLLRADQMVERLRERLEKDIDDSFFADN